MERHFTVTTYVIKESESLILLLFHPKHQKWLPPGGHLEANETPPEAAKREVLEETGIEIELKKQENLWFNCWNAASFERPYLCLLENIPPHGKTAAHQHIDLIYLAKPIGGREHANLLERRLLRWMSQDDVEHLTEDEIFSETKETIKHLLK